MTLLNEPVAPTGALPAVRARSTRRARMHHVSAGAARDLMSLIRECIARQDLTLREVASRSGTLSEDHLSAMLAGRIEPNLTSVDDVLRALGLQLRIAVTPANVPEALRAEVAAAVAASDLTQAVISGLAGMTEKHLSEVLAGKTGISLLLAAEVLKACGRRLVIASESFDIPGRR